MTENRTADALAVRAVLALAGIVLVGRGIAHSPPVDRGVSQVDQAGLFNFSGKTRYKAIQLQMVIRLHPLRI